MSSYDNLYEAEKKAYHVVDCLKNQGFDPALREVYKHCASWPENTGHSFYDQLNLPKDGFLKPPNEFGQMTQTLGKTSQCEKELLQRRGELDKWEAALKRRETEKIAKQEKMQQSVKAFNLREAQLNDWETKLTARETRFRLMNKSVQVRFDASGPPSDDSPDEVSAHPTGREDPASRGPGNEMVWCRKCELLFDPQRNHAHACEYHPLKLDAINPEDCLRLTGKPAEAFDGRKGLELLLASYPGCLVFGCCFSKSRAGCTVGPHHQIFDMVEKTTGKSGYESASG